MLAFFLSYKNKYKSKTACLWIKAKCLQVQSNIDKCMFQGTLAHDPDSRVLVNKCKQVIFCKVMSITNTLEKYDDKY
jgi:hypothetical protein